MHLAAICVIERICRYTIAAEVREHHLRADQLWQKQQRTEEAVEQQLATSEVCPSLMTITTLDNTSGPSLLVKAVGVLVTQAALP